MSQREQCVQSICYANGKYLSVAQKEREWEMTGRENGLMRLFRTDATDTVGLCVPHLRI